MWTNVMSITQYNSITLSLIQAAAQNSNKSNLLAYKTIKNSRSLEKVRSLEKLVFDIMEMNFMLIY